MVENEIEILKSLKLITSVVNKLEAQYRVCFEGKFCEHEYHGNSSIAEYYQ
jgi:hypothetical protein